MLEFSQRDQSNTHELEAGTDTEQIFASGCQMDAGVNLQFWKPTHDDKRILFFFEVLAFF